MRVPFLLALLLAAAGGATATPSSDSELVLLVSLSRHGSRAPNPSVHKHCPKNAANLKAYQVPPEQLTERGMQQMEAAGRHVRQVYVDDKKFLSSSFNSDDRTHFETYFRADAAPRCGQSAIAFGYGLYPDGTGPAGYAKQPIPVFMQLWENEHDFTANAPCFAVMQAHATHYAATRGERLIARHADALNKAAEICGTTFFKGGDQVLATKDVADMFAFDRDEGLAPTPGLTPELTDELSTLAFQNLIERLYSTPREVTTAIGGFPQLLVRTLTDATDPSWSSAKATKYFSFHGHRELLHGLGFMLGMKFNFGDGMPAFNGSTALHPGTTLFFELHRQAQGDGADVSSTRAQFVVKLFVWSPQSPRTAVKLNNCDLACPLADFTAIIETHIAETGTWQDICNYHPVNIPRALPASPVAPSAVVESATSGSEVVGVTEVPELETWPPLPAPTVKTATHVRTEPLTTVMAEQGAPAVVSPLALQATAKAAAGSDSSVDVQTIVHWALTVSGVAVLSALCVSTLQRRRSYVAL